MPFETRNISCLAHSLGIVLFHRKHLARIDKGGIVLRQRVLAAIEISEAHASYDCIIIASTNVPRFFFRIIIDPCTPELEGVQGVRKVRGVIAREK